MSNAPDMSAPVTRGELREELERFTQTVLTRIEAGEQRLAAELARMATKTELEVMSKQIGDAERRMVELMGKQELRIVELTGKQIGDAERRLAEWTGKQISDAERRTVEWTGKQIGDAEQRLAEWFGKQIGDLERRLHAELAGHARAHHEAVMTMISVIDEKYADLPGRMKRVEGAVFPSERR